AGIVVCCSAGNRGFGYGTVGVPGDDPYVLTVGAVKHQGSPNRANHLLCSFSSRGPTLVDHYLKPDVTSVGNRITSLRSPNSYLDTLYSSNQIPATSYGGAASEPCVYFNLSGTSMATPTVAGTAALMIQKDPS